MNPRELILGILKNHRSRDTRIKRNALVSRVVFLLLEADEIDNLEYSHFLSDSRSEEHWDRKVRKWIEELRLTNEGCYIFATSGDGGGYWLGTRPEVDEVTLETLAKAERMKHNAYEQRRLAKLPVPKPVQVQLPLEIVEGAQDVYNR